MIALGVRACASERVAVGGRSAAQHRRQRRSRRLAMIDSVGASRSCHLEHWGQDLISFGSAFPRCFSPPIVFLPPPPLAFAAHPENAETLAPLLDGLGAERHRRPRKPRDFCPPPSLAAHTALVQDMFGHVVV